jgi:hypothetical protein
MTLAAVGAAPAAANGRFPTGRYSGRTSQGLPISFKIAHRHVSKLRFRVRMECSDYEVTVTLKLPRRRVNRLPSGVPHSLRPHHPFFWVRHHTRRSDVDPMIGEYRGHGRVKGEFDSVYEDNTGAPEQCSPPNVTVKFKAHRGR